MSDEKKKESGWFCPINVLTGVGILVVVVIAVWGGSYKLYAQGVAARESKLAKTTARVDILEDNMIGVNYELGALKLGQQTLKENISLQTEDIINAFKKYRNGP